MSTQISPCCTSGRRKDHPRRPAHGRRQPQEFDEDSLRRLAERASGAYFHEREADQFLKRIDKGLQQKTVFIESNLFQAGPWFALLLLALLVAEWYLRRKRNLV